MDIDQSVHQLDIFLNHIFKNNINNIRQLNKYILNEEGDFIKFLINLSKSNKSIKRIQKSFIFENIDINILLYSLFNNCELHIFIQNDIDSKILNILISEGIFVLENLSRVNINPVRHLIFKKSSSLVYHGCKNSNFYEFNISTINKYIEKTEKNSFCLFFRPSNIIFGDFFNLILEYPYYRMLPSNIKNT